MTWEEALEIVVARTGHEPYRTACADSHPGHEAWRARMVEKATGLPPVPAYPPIAVQAGNVAGAVVRVVGTAASGQSVFAPDEEQSRRLTICRGCENFDVGRCRICGCNLALKVWLKTEHCPLEPPKW